MPNADERGHPPLTYPSPTPDEAAELGKLQDRIERLTEKVQAVVAKKTDPDAEARLAIALVRLGHYRQVLTEAVVRLGTMPMVGGELSEQDQNLIHRARMLLEEPGF